MLRDLLPDRLFRERKLKRPFPDPICDPVIIAQIRQAHIAGEKRDQLVLVPAINNAVKPFSLISFTICIDPANLTCIL